MHMRTFTVAVCLVVMVAACGDETTSTGATGATGTGGDGGAGGVEAAGGSGGVMVGACADNLCFGAAASPACSMCIDSQCASELAACQGDTAAGSACSSCADRLADPSIPTSELCVSSAMLAGAFDGCVCGDGVGIAGKCR
jgi:hypothetical protein